MIKKYFWLIPAVLMIPTSALNASFDPKILQAIDRGVFEIVVPKIENPSIVYEKELPMDMLPFQIRNDTYYSIGTAFLIGKNRFATAAHVFSFQYDSQDTSYFIRDSQKNTYEIETILGYSSDKDFAVFSVKGGSFVCPFRFKSRPTMNSPVYAVGNALGEGIIVRDGLLTSETQEEFEGKWKWLRFSAAASPGNSGGPLIDKDGFVIGIVLRKSENENLNFALPWSVFSGFQFASANVREKFPIRLVNSRKNLYRTFEASSGLPKKPSELRNDLASQHTKFYMAGIGQLLREHRDQFFPNGVKSDLILYVNDYKAGLPRLLYEDENSYWRTFNPPEPDKTFLDNNGYIVFSKFDHLGITFLKYPDDADGAKFCADSTLFMDTLLKGISIYRRLGVEQIKVKSLGPAAEDYLFEDSYKRIWICRKWKLPYADEIISTLSLPTPEGIASLIFYGRTNQSFLAEEIKFYADFVVQDYSGTLAQWKRFLSSPNFVPAALKDLKVEFKDNSDSGEIISHFVTLKSSNNLTPVKGDSLLKATVDFERIGDQTVILDISTLTLSPRNSDDFIKVSRYKRPVPGLPSSYETFWEKIVRKESPFNLVPINIEGLITLSDTIDNGAFSKKGRAYTLSVGTEDRKKVDGLYRKIQILKESVRF